MCIDRLRSSELRRRAYVGPWLPEPIIGFPGDAVDPADRVTLDESVRMAMMVAIEQLTPAERTVFILADVFGAPFDEVAVIVGRSPAACRQLAVRARARIEVDNRGRFRPAPDEACQVVELFAEACATGDLDALVGVLDPNASGEFDSAGLIPGVPLDAVSGAVTVALVLHGAFSGMGASFEIEPINGEPGIVVGLAGQTVAVIALEIRDGLVVHDHGVGSPDKLRRRQ